MSATIDHLESHFHVTVIRGFTDARGVVVPFHAGGVIRRMDVDWKAQEITIDWERDGPAGRTPERLTFALNATDGPRNNHMRDYFEKGEFVSPPRAPKPPKPKPEPEPTVDPAKLAAFEGRQPQEEICLNERIAACTCDAAFHRKLVPAGRLHVAACLHCGAVTVTKQVGDDGRFTGNAWTAYWTVPTPQLHVDWLARFPRVAIDYAGAPWRWPMSATLVRYPTLFYPAALRINDVADIDGIETSFWETQSAQMRGARLASACGDIPPPPADLSEDFRGFASIREALYLAPGSNFDTLRRHAHLLSPSSELAAALLIRRPRAYDTMLGWLRSSNDDDFSAGIAMLRDARSLFSGPGDPRLAPELLKILNALPLGPLTGVPQRVESWSRFESLLVAIADLGANSQAMRDGLSQLHLKLSQRDPTVRDAITIVINELNGVDNRPKEYR